ncbi:MAG: polymorphic toxin type 23 domain-containing protein, partial [Muribaculum sp.]|nr:polymorphic toxin type 23 domain-containing protein [Muribaculum sp.]
SPDPYVQDPTLPQNFNRYSYCLNNPLLYCDQSGEWFGLDDLFVAAVGFTAGYFSNALSTGNWGWSSVKAGLTGAGMCWLGYNTAGLATGAITNATLTHAGQIGLSALTANITPSIGFKIGNVSIGISINPLIGLGTGGFTYGMGMGVSAAYKDLCISAGVGVGNHYQAWNVGATIDDIGGGYGRTYYGPAISPNKEFLGSQSVGTINAYCKDFAIAFSNDKFGDGEDRWRTNAIEVSYKNFSIGSYIDTNWGSKESNRLHNNPTDYNAEAPAFGKHDNNHGKWKEGDVHMAPIWVGYRQGNLIYRTGLSHRNVQNWTQNFVHKYVTPTNYFLNYSDMYSGAYNYVGSVNPFSLWTY